MNVNHLYFLFEENMKKTFEPSDPYIFVKTLPYIFYFIFSRFLGFFPTTPQTWNTQIVRHPVCIFAKKLKGPTNVWELLRTFSSL
jgi:hypothetical protein